MHSFFALCARPVGSIRLYTERQSLLLGGAAAPYRAEPPGSTVATLLGG